VVNWEIVYAKQALKDAKKLAASGLKQKAQAILAFLQMTLSRIRRPMKDWSAAIRDESTFNTDSFMKYSPRKKSSVCYAGRSMNSMEYHKEPEDFEPVVEVIPKYPAAV
jgi:hypothetical protein